MGDVVFPGIQFHKVQVGRTKEEFMTMIYDVFGTEPTLYENFKPEVKFLVEPGQDFCNVVVSGILVPYNEIRRKLEGVRLKKELLKLRGVDFGLPRLNNGQLSHLHKCLHDHMCHSQGLEMKPINLVNLDFSTNELGKWDPHSNVILLNREGQRMNIRMLKEPGQHLFHWEDKDNPGHTAITYMYVIDALQALMYLNFNTRFIGPPACFVTTNDVQYDRQDYPGKEGKKIQVEKLMNTKQMIPFNEFSKEVLNAGNLTRFATECHVCKTDFSLLGYSPNFDWFAVSCQCLGKNARNPWKGESFLRMIPNPPLRKMLDIYEKLTDDRPPVVQMIKGLTPLFADVREYISSGHEAAIADYRQNQLDLAKHNTQLGTITSCFYLEDSEKETEQWAVIIATKKTSVWSVEKQGAIARVTCVPPQEGTTFTGDKKTDFLLWGPTHLRFSGKVFDIKVYESDPSLVNVEVVITKAWVHQFHAGMTCVLVPKPPRTEVMALRRFKSGWLKCDHKRRQQMMTGHVTTSCFTREVYHHSETQLQHFWLVYIRLSKVDEHSLEECEIEKYEGAELYISTRKRMTGEELILKRTGRILSRIANHDGITIKVGVILEPDYDIFCNCEIQFQAWAIQKVKPKRPTHVTIIPAGYENMDEARSDDDHDSDIEANEEEEEGVVAIPEEDEATPSKVQVYVQEWLPNLEYQDEDDIVRNWKVRPQATNFTLLDFLLKRREKYILHPMDLCLVQSKTVDEDLVRAITSEMNASQRLAIDNMMTKVLTGVVGPPGCGKSTTASLGVLRLCVQERGIVLVCCPSNYAATLLYEKIRDDSIRFGINLRIIRMLARSREKADMASGTPLSEKDQNLLHVQIRQSSDWLTEGMKSIIQRADTNGWMNLLDKERKELNDHINAIGKKILLRANVVVSTVGCAGNSRLASVAKTLNNAGKTFSGLVIDESSLLTVPSVLPLLTLNPSRVTLFGDPNQLSATIKSESAKHACLGVSSMEMMQMTPYVQNGGKQVYSMLDTQYRMANEIATIVSKFLYDDKVKSDASVLRRNYQKMIKYVNPSANCDFRRTFDNLRRHNIGLYTYLGHREEKNKEDDSKSIWNPKEIEITKELLKKLLRSGIVMKNVVVIAMYALQVEKLQESVGEMGPAMKDVTFATVDSFQGKESDIVILNIVRSNKDNNLGFIKDVRRLNVAMSRARDYLFVVCDKKCLVASTVKPFILLFQLMKQAGVTPIVC